jgi:hypothetical protein
MTNTTIEVPVLEQLVTMSGTTNSPVTNLSFVGLTFRLANWLLPSRGYGLLNGQANQAIDITYTMPAAFDCAGARNIEVNDCTFDDLGGVGVNLRAACQNDTVMGCTFSNIAGSAIQAGPILTRSSPSPDQYYPLGSPDIVSNILVSCCMVHDVCQDYQAGCGIFFGYTENCMISHNTIYNVPWSAISLGWGWGASVACTISNQIVGNLVYNHMQEFPDGDGGGIYCLGVQQSGRISGNYIYNQENHYADIYLDEGSSYWTVLSNVVEMASAKVWYLVNGGKSNLAIFNYVDNNTIEISGPGNTISNTTVYSHGSPPQAALNIMNKAGINGVVLRTKSPFSNGVEMP